jgi:hypothetical protein
MEIEIRAGCNLLTCSHCFPSGIKVDILQSYFNRVENFLDTHNFRVAFIGDFNIRSSDCEHGSCTSNWHCYSEQKGEAMYASTRVLGLSVIRLRLVGICLMLFFLTSMTEILRILSMVWWHLIIITDVLLATCRLLHNEGPSYLNYASNNYLMLYESSANCDWTCVYNQTSVDLAVYSLNAVVNEAATHPVPISYHRANRFLRWYSGTLKYYIRKKKIFL